jgi:hypothetical protein
MKAIIGIIVLAILLVGMMPFLNTASKIEWTTYLGIPLIIFTGSAGTAFVTKRFEAIIGGAVLSVLWPIIYGVILIFL